MFVIVWNYRAKVGSESEFETHYCSTGTWVQFFRRGDGFLGTELLCDADVVGNFATIDRWASREKFEAFRSANIEEYRAIDALCDALTVSEVHVGNFETRDEG